MRRQQVSKAARGILKYTWPALIVAGAIPIADGICSISESLKDRAQQRAERKRVETENKTYLRIASDVETPAALDRLTPQERLKLGEFAWRYRLDREDYQRFKSVAVRKGAGTNLGRLIEAYKLVREFSRRGETPQEQKDAIREGTSQAVLQELAKRARESQPDSIPSINFNIYLGRVSRAFEVARAAADSIAEKPQWRRMFPGRVGGLYFIMNAERGRDGNYAADWREREGQRRELTKRVLRERGRPI